MKLILQTGYQSNPLIHLKKLKINIKSTHKSKTNQTKPKAEKSHLKEPIILSYLDIFTFFINAFYFNILNHQPLDGLLPVKKRTRVARLTKVMGASMEEGLWQNKSAKLETLLTLLILAFN